MNEASLYIESFSMKDFIFSYKHCYYKKTLDSKTVTYYQKNKKILVTVFPHVQKNPHMTRISNLVFTLHPKALKLYTKDSSMEANIPSEIVFYHSVHRSLWFAQVICSSLSLRRATRCS